MLPLSVLKPDTKALLDFLCHAHDRRCRVKKLKGVGMAMRLRTLHRYGFVERGGHAPTPDALAAWKFRNQSDSSAPTCTREPEGPPKRMAAKQGGGAAARNHDAPPPTLGLTREEAQELPKEVVAQLSKPAQDEVAALIEETAPARRHEPDVEADAADDPHEPRPPTGNDLADRLEAWAKAHSASIFHLARYLFGSHAGIRKLRTSKVPLQRTIDKVDAFIANPHAVDLIPAPRRRGRAPKINPLPSFPGDGDGVSAAQRAQRYRTGMRKKARQLLDDGVSTSSTKLNAHERAAMNDLMRSDANQARAACPVEQAKTIIRRRGHNCFDASVHDGEKKGKGFYYINNRRVSEAALLAEAEEMRRR